MRITTKGRYALRAIIALAETSQEGNPASIKSIAERENLSAEFLEQIFFNLRRAGIISSVRGPGGGFYLARPLAEISLLDIIEASGEGLGIAPCVCGKEEDCGRDETCAAGAVWRELDSHLRTFVTTKTLEDIVGVSKN